jgi:hypothetical protein
MAEDLDSLMMQLPETPNWWYEERAKGNDSAKLVVAIAEICAIGVGVAIAFPPLWIVPAAKAGAALIASHAGLTVGPLISGVQSLLEGKAPGEIAKDMVKAGVISTLVEDPLTQWLKGIQASR